MTSSVKGTFKWQALDEPKIVQLVKELYKLSTAKCSKGKPVNGPLIIEKPTSFYDNKKISNKCIEIYVEFREV